MLSLIFCRNYNFYGSIVGIQTKLRRDDDTLLENQEIKQVIKTKQSMFLAVMGNRGCMYSRQNDVICHIPQRCLHHISRTCESVILHSKDKTEVADEINHSLDLRIGKIP